MSATARAVARVLAIAVLVSLVGSLIFIRLFDETAAMVFSFVWGSFAGWGVAALHADRLIDAFDEDYERKHRASR